MSFFDFNTADQQQSFDLIPKGTLARVRMSIKPGGFDDASQGWTGGWATRSQDTGAVYLACEGVVMQGPFARRKVWWNIGLHSAKGSTWMQMVAPSCAPHSTARATSILATTAHKPRPRGASAALAISMAWSSPPASTSRKMAGARTRTPSSR